MLLYYELFYFQNDVHNFTHIGTAFGFVLENQNVQ